MIRFWQSLLAVLMVSLLFAGCGKKKKKESPGEKEEVKEVQDWPIFRRDAELQGVSSEDLKYPLELAWTFEPKVEEGKRRLPIIASPVISDGVIYVGSQEGKFFAINLEDGKKSWEFKAEGPIEGPAAVYGSRIFFGDTYGIFYALNAEGGTEAWRFEAEDKIQGGVNLLEDKDGVFRVFFGSDDNYLYCLDAGSGELLWKHETGNLVVAAPSIVNSGGQQAVTFGGCDGIFHIVNANGEGEPRAIEVGSYITNSSAVRDGIAYVMHNGGEVLAIEIESGEIVWKVTTGSEYRGCAAVGEKVLYVPTQDKSIVAYDRVSGDEIWNFKARRGFDSSPVLTESAIWAAGDDGFLYAINPDDGTELWNWEMGTQVKASPAISRGKMVICGDDGVIYAFKEAAPSDDNS